LVKQRGNNDKEKGKKGKKTRLRIKNKNVIREYSPQVSLLELLGKAFDDSTIIILMVAGTLSLGLGLAIPSPGGNDWIEGAAILAAVAVVVGVSAGNDYQKEKQFRELSNLSEESEVPSPSVKL
jgi:magnesium-transporting ATPase (P-type)